MSVVELCEAVRGVLRDDDPVEWLGSLLENRLERLSQAELGRLLALSIGAVMQLSREVHDLREDLAVLDRQVLHLRASR